MVTPRICWQNCHWCQQVCVGVSWCPLRSPWGLEVSQCERRPFDLVQAQVWSPWSPWDNGKSPEHLIECLSTSKIGSLVPQLSSWFPSTTTMPYYPIKCSWWVEKVARVQMTLSVVICVWYWSWYHRRSLGTPHLDGYASSLMVTHLT